MSEADNSQISREVGSTEMLLNAMLGRPVAEYVEGIKELTEEEINAKNSTGRTMLHQAVILGKADWTRELLEAGADQMVKDGDGKTALQLAKEMLSKQAGEKERKDLLDIMLDRPAVGSGIASCGSSGDVSASISTVRLILKLGESLKSNFSHISTQFNTMAESHEGMKVELKAVKNSIEGVKDGLSSVEKSIEGVKGEVTTTVEKFKTQIQNVELKVDAVIPMIISLHREAYREFCIESMTGKTKVIPSNEEKKSKMRKLYEIMYDRDSVLSSILRFIRLQSVEVHVDFESDSIGGMKPTLRDHDGRERSGGEFNVFADFEERKAYVGWRYVGDDNIIFGLALALSQLCVLLAFGNKGLPYSEDGEREKELYKGILEEAERKKRDGEELNPRIRRYALDRRTTHMGKGIYLHAMVPAIIAFEESSHGRYLLKTQLPSLLEYYEDHVMTALRVEKHW